MGSQTFGNSSPTWFGEEFDGFATGVNLVASAFTMPATGTIDTLHVYAGGANATTQMRLCLWDSNGNLLAASAQFTAPSYGTGIGGQGWQVRSITPTLVQSGATVFIGFWRPNSAGNSSNFSYSSGGNHNEKSNQSSYSVESGGSAHSGTLGAYAEYNPVTALYRVYRSGAWATGTVYVYRTGAWVTANATDVYRSTVWTTTT